MICLADNTEHADERALHLHLLKIKLKQVDYYRRYHTKRDLLTGEEIPWTTREKYLRTDFLDKHNLNRFLKESPLARDWAIGWLKHRKEEKGLVFAPTHVELRSLSCPSIEFYEANGGYNAICSSLGLKPRFAGSLSFAPLTAEATLIRDTREQKPLKLPGNVIVQKLEVGDYGLAAPHDRGIYIERKSLSDFVGTLSTKKTTGLKKNGEDSEALLGFDRFRAELGRAKALGAYLVMLVEDELTRALSFDYLPHLRWATRTSPDHVFRNLRLLLNEFPDFQVLFVGGRIEAAKVMMQLFRAGDSVKQTDLQLAYERGGFDVD